MSLIIDFLIKFFNIPATFTSEELGFGLPKAVLSKALEFIDQNHYPETIDNIKA